MMNLGNLARGRTTIRTPCVKRKAVSMERMQVVTANRLSDGEVVYLAADGGWTRWIDEGRVVVGKPLGEQLLAEAKPSVDACLVVAAYLMDVDRTGGRLMPVSVRERIRAAGPSVRKDLGKQAHTGRR